MEQKIEIERLEQAVNVFGSFDENIRLIETEFQVSVTNREGELRITGEPEDTMLAVKALNALLTLSSRGENIGEQTVRYVIGLARSGQEDKVSELTQDVICITAKGRPVKPKTIGQKQYVESIMKNTVTIGVGPAGTGKTYLAVAAAVAAFREKQVNRIILTRPAVEAGERLGFLPGDLQSKVDPYRMGFGSKVVITGDVTQIDLPADKTSGLKEAVRVLKNVEGIGLRELTAQDVVRHVMVQRIIKAYDDYYSNSSSNSKRKRG